MQDNAADRLHAVHASCRRACAIHLCHTCGTPISYDCCMSQKKLAQLGIPIGTATHRLRKLLLFHLASELELNHCHRCRQTIESPDDLGIDHKEPWLDVSVERFWDLGNVAFSHKLCNTRARRSAMGRKLGPSLLRKVGPPGTAWCDGCNEFLPTTSFNRNRSKWNGLQSFCKLCDRSGRLAGRRSRRQLPISGFGEGGI